MSYLLNIYIQTPNSDFFKKSAFESGLLILRNIHLFSNFVFSCFCENLLLKCAYRPWDHFYCLVEKLKIIVKHKSNLGSLVFP